MTRLIDLSHTVEDGTSFHIGRIDMVANTGTYVDPPFHRFADGKRPVHTTLLGADIPIAEHLRGLEQLPEIDFTSHAAPVKVRGMGTFPVRAYAVA